MDDRESGTVVIAHQEIAVTCDGCGESHWVKIAPAGEGE